MPPIGRVSVFMASQRDNSLYRVVKVVNAIQVIQVNWVNWVRSSTHTPCIYIYIHPNNSISNKVLK